MKVSNWRRKLAAALVAGGLISPAAARAADLNVNLVVNPGFENVDVNTTEVFYGGPLILDWVGPVRGFAYSHNASVTATSGPDGVPDYANGPPLAGGGNWYFTPGNNGNDSLEDAITQTIDVSAGNTATAIKGGFGRFSLSAFFSTFSTQQDRGVLRATFLDRENISLGFAETATPPETNLTDWTQLTTTGIVPLGTKTIRMANWGIAATGSADGYTDNIDFRLSQAPTPQPTLLSLEVNTVTGQATIKNQTGAGVQIDYYDVFSASNALKPATWTSLQDQNLAGFPAGNGSGNGWEEAGAVSTGIVGESFLTGSSTIVSGVPVSLGSLFNTAGAQDLEFRFVVLTATLQTADFDADSDVDGGDFLRWQRGVGITTGATKGQGDADGDGDVDGADLGAWKDQFGKSAFFGPGTVAYGPVQYVTPAAAAVPEPSTIVIVGLGLAAVAVVGRKRKDIARRD